jgi:hypothetical protein
MVGKHIWKVLYKDYSILSQFNNKHGCDRQFLFLIGRGEDLLEINQSETRIA